MLHENNISVVLIQESILPTRPIHISGYTQYQCNCENACQGIMTLVRNDTQATVVNNSVDIHLDTQKISLWDKTTRQLFTMYNIYCPPKSTCDLKVFDSALYTRTILAGDFKAYI